ncbi:response regulator [uncultured Tateyamaria sp.]|uniref:response regulator n=1 Tax=uncultured Tateyamaria sp. TaxID=455651 RepID=UPI00263914C2|nr:response regulator [uncultured Tateyamaria sp.]
MAIVLVLEDDPGLQFTFCEALEEAGHKVHIASNNEQAMNAMRRCAPDVLLLDLMVSGGLSTDVANYAGYCAPDAEVIYVTGSGLFTKGELFSMTRNASMVLRKPVNLRELTMMINHVAPSAMAVSAAN